MPDKGQKQPPHKKNGQHFPLEQGPSNICVCVYIYTHTYAVELKTGPSFGR